MIPVSDIFAGGDAMLLSLPATAAGYFAIPVAECHQAAKGIVSSPKAKIKLKGLAGSERRNRVRMGSSPRKIIPFAGLS
jgi:hypothetical protein